jgi:gamma-glutamyltranspeptidase/glutathione hydrolase
MLKSLPLSELIVGKTGKGKPSREVRLAHWAMALLLAVMTACSPADPTPAQSPTDMPSPPAIGGVDPLDLDWRDVRAVATASAESGMVVGTMAPDAVRAGVQILQQGGSAADAALATALAQVPLLLGNFVTYAGIMEFLYYDAQSEQVYSMNAGWQVPRAETDPLSIPYTLMPYNGTSKPSGRTALVPGFMAGLESAHKRFGTVPFPALFEPAIDLSRQGVVIDDLQAGFIAQWEPVITRLPETAALFTREDGRLVQAGDRFRQPLLASTLEGVAREGAAYMYTGAWGQKFVETIQRQGGKITAEDMAAYQPLWTEPTSTSYAGYDLYGPGLPGLGGVSVVEGFHLIEAAGLQRYGHFSQDPESLFWMMQIVQAAKLGGMDAQESAILFPGQDLSLESRLTRKTSAGLWERIQAGQLPLFTPRQGTGNTHSAAVVAVDSRGNIAAMTHTSNAYLYGGSGISVDGIYIPDPGSYMQNLMQAAGAGSRLPNPINPVIVLRDGQPVWASSCIGNVHDETLQRLASVLTFGLDLPAAQRAPAFLAARFGDGSQPFTAQVFPGDFDPGVIQAVQDLGQPVDELPITFDTFATGRGVLAAIGINPQTGALSGTVPTVLGGFAAGY